MDTRRQELLQLGCCLWDISIAYQLSVAIATVDQAVFSHRPAQVSFRAGDGDQTIAAYSRTFDRYSVNVSGLALGLAAESLNLATDLGHLGIHIDTALVNEVVLWGIAVHEVRHRLQKHLGDNLKKWIDGTRESSSEDDAWSVEFQYRLQCAFARRRVSEADAVWKEP